MIDDLYLVYCFISCSANNKFHRFVQSKNISLLRHNEDGSYTYGYKAEDGSFKLETRHPDGRVIGKYGYIDIDTGKVKVIEYGADMMGFQPEGDFPEGIIIPPPVNGTDDDYDYVDPAIDVDDRRLPQANAAPGFDNNPQGFR